MSGATAIAGTPFCRDLILENAFDVNQATPIIYDPLAFDFA